jgi:hypothetical protein
MTTFASEAARYRGIFRKLLNKLDNLPIAGALCWAFAGH